MVTFSNELNICFSRCFNLYFRNFLITMKISLGFISVLMAIASLSFAQDNMIGVNIKVYQPLSGMAANIGAVPFGLSFNYLRSLRQTRFSAGGEIGVAMYSSNDYTLSYQGRDILVNEEDCFWTFHGVVRYDFVKTPRFISYVTAKLGMTTFFSSITAMEANSTYPGTFDFHGSAFNTGIGGGIMFRPKKPTTQDAGGFWINLGATFHSGSETDYRYMPEGGPAVPLDAGHYESLTHYMGYRLGFVFKF